MSPSPITLDALAAAFTLPPGERPRRVPKATLSDNVPTASDRKLIDTKLVKLEWIAAINTASTGIPAGSSDGLTIDTINLLTAHTRGPMHARLAEIIHRAIPKPVVLLHWDERGDSGAGLSLATKRSAEREVGRVVTTDLYDTGSLAESDAAFLHALSLARLPARDLAALYAGLVARLEALAAARAADRTFRLPDTPEERGAWQSALAEIASLSTELATLSAAMRKASRLSAKVELGEKSRQLKLRLDAVQALLK